MKKQKQSQAEMKFYIQWHFLDGCNLKCRHCYQEDAALRKMSIEEVDVVLDKIDHFMKNVFLNDCDTVQINLTGGEPLLYPEIFSVIDKIRARGYKWALLTNGILLNQEMAEKLSERKPVFVQVSLEGDRELNDEIRGEGTFDKICQAVTLLNSVGIKTLVSFTVNSLNYKAFPKVAEICREIGAHKLWCDRYVGNDELALKTEEFREFIHLLEDEVKKNSHEGKRSRILPAKAITSTKIAAERSLQFNAGGDGYICGAGGNLLVILPDGELLPCRRLPLSLGNVIKDGEISEILEKSLVWKELQRPVISAGCAGCEDFYRCRGGAKCVLYAQTGKLHGRDVNCLVE